ncbi:MAG: hypothetical protein KDD82_19520, partial [Planctomycetes bacterium]|nr:hypothetical protein [Planctomycetota bacterium]
MADAKLRALERRFSDEGDLAAGRELAASLRRAGAPVCGPLLAADVRPGLSFASELPLGVHVLTGDDEVRWLGNTPRPNPLQVPEHRAWWVQPLRSEAEHLRRAVEALRAQGIPGLAVGGRGANGLIPPLPMHLETLRLQRRVVGRGELDFADADPPLVVPNLTRLSLDGAGSVEVDPGEALTEVALSGAEQACRELVERFAGRGLPLTRLDLRAFRELDLGEAAWARLPALRELRVETGVFGCPVEAELAHLERL